MESQKDKLLERAYKIMLQVYSYNPLTRDLIRQIQADDVKQEMKKWCEDFMSEKALKGDE